MNILFWSSFFLFIPTDIYGIYLQKWEYTFMVCCVTFTSLNYHRNPLDICFRRTIDWCTVGSAMVYQQLYCNNYHINPVPLLVCNSIGFFYFFVSKITQNEIFHVFFHLFGTIGNLYVLHSSFE
jgi:hypothetical protein